MKTDQITDSSLPPGTRSPEQRALVAAEFNRAREDAALPYEVGQLVLFGGNGEIDQVEQYLHKEVERMLYEPTLPNGGNKERAMIERLKPMSLNLQWDGHSQAAYAIKRWKSVLPHNPAHAGRYYRRQPMTAKQDQDKFKWCCDLRDSAHISRRWDQKWFAEMMLEGLPEPVSNFRMECVFLLKKIRRTSGQAR